MAATVKAFSVKLRLWESQTEKKTLKTFIRMTTLKSEHVPWEEALIVLMNLQEQFATLFKCLRDYEMGLQC